MISFSMFEVDSAMRKQYSRVSRIRIGAKVTVSNGVREGLIEKCDI